MDVLYIVIPAYNEEANIEKVIEDWYPIVEKNHGDGKSRLVIFDDGSKDSTYQMICEAAKSRPLLLPKTKKNGGHGATILEGYQFAVEHGADYIFQTDSDGQTLPSEFGPFWEQRKQYDMVIGQRTKRQDGFSRVVVTKVLKAVVACIFGVSVEDANAPYRLMTRESLKDVISAVPAQYNLSNVIVSVAYRKFGYSVKSIPITFRPRQGGVNSINIKRIIGIGRRALKSFAEINKDINKEVRKRAARR